MSATSSGTIQVASFPRTSGASVKEAAETPCEVCGNVYDKAFQVVMRGQTHTFDCFECAIQMLAPLCQHCGCRIIGHGVETEAGRMFCGAHCARKAGVAIELRA